MVDTYHENPALNAGFEEFMRTYLRMKYAQGNLRAEDYDIIARFSKNAGPAIRSKNGFIKTTLNYFNVLRAFRYFQQPESTDNETISL